MRNALHAIRVGVVFLVSAVSGCDAAPEHASDDPDASSAESDSSQAAPDAANVPIDPRCPAVPIAGEVLFPDATRVDWVSFADHAAAVEVQSEAVIPPPNSVSQTGEGYVGRKVRVRVADTIWSNRFAQALPSEIEFKGLGWLKRQSCAELVPVYGGRDHPAPRLEVRGKYVIALVLYTVVDQGWGPLTPGSAFADGDDATATADIAATGINPAAQSLSGLTHDEVRAKLDGTEPHPSVREALNLPAEDRLARAQSP